MIIDYLKKQIKTYFESFSDTALLAKVLIVDIALAFSVYLTFMLSQIIMRSPIKSISAVNLDNIAEKSLEELKSSAYSMRHFLIALVLTAIGVFLFTIILYSVFQGIAWNEILKKKLSIRYLLKFTSLNLIWFICSAIIIMLLLMGANQTIFRFIVAFAILLLAYLTMLLANLFTKNPKWNQLKQTFKIGILKIHHFIIPLALIIITILLARGITGIYERISAYISILLSIFLFSWVKIYFSQITRNI